VYGELEVRIPFAPAESRAVHTCFIGEPASETGPLYNPRLVFVTLFSVAAANSLGIARGAIEAFVELAGRESSTSSTAALRDRSFVQAHLAEAEAILNAARAYVIDALGALWETVCSGAADPSITIGQARLAIVHAMHEAVRSGRLGVSCRRHERDLHPESVGTTFPGYPCRCSAQQRISSAV
jgi:hypothetical protein